MGLESNKKRTDLDWITCYNLYCLNESYSSEKMNPPIGKFKSDSWEKCASSHENVLTAIYLIIGFHEFGSTSGLRD